MESNMLLIIVFLNHSYVMWLLDQVLKLRLSIDFTFCVQSSGLMQEHQTYTVVQEV